MKYNDSKGGMRGDVVVSFVPLCMYLLVAAFFRPLVTTTGFILVRTATISSVAASTRRRVLYMMTTANHTTMPTTTTNTLDLPHSTVPQQKRAREDATTIIVPESPLLETCTLIFASLLSQPGWTVERLQACSACLETQFGSSSGLYGNTMPDTVSDSTLPHSSTNGFQQEEEGEADDSTTLPSAASHDAAIVHVALQ